MFGEPGLHPAAGLQPECRAAGQRDGVNPLHGVGDVEQRALAGARAAAAYIDRCYDRRIEHHRRDAGRQRRIVGVADADAGNIGEQIFHRMILKAQMTARLCCGQPH